MGKKIVICDDHVLFCNGIAEILKKLNPEYQITTCYNSEDCIRAFKDSEVDIFICDLNIDKTDGFELIESLKPKLNGTKIIILSAYYEDFLIQKAERKGIHAFLKKETTSEELIEIIESSVNSPFYSQKKLQKSINIFAQKDSTISNKFRLSNQEKEIIKLIVQGKTSKEIADILYISKMTVDTHRRNINKKLAVTNSSSLVKFAHENNLCN